MFFNKYPYTDFHELNLDFVLSQISELKSTVTEFTELVETYDDRITATESNITLLQGANIQDAIMLKEVSSVTADASKVRVNFVKDTYTDGAKAAGTDYADLPAATDSAAGLLVPGDKNKLAKMTLSGDDVTFAGAVKSSEIPSVNSDLTNKAYVDALAMTGVSPVAVADAMDTAWSVSATIGTIGTAEASGYIYGSLKQLDIHIPVTPPAETYTIVTSGTGIASGVIVSSLRPDSDKVAFGYIEFVQKNYKVEHIPCALSIKSNGNVSVIAMAAYESSNPDRSTDMYISAVYI